MAKIDIDKKVAYAERFLSFFKGRIFIRSFDDDKKRASVKLTHTYTQVESLREIADELLALNKAGAGIYFSVNELVEGKTINKAENIGAVRAHFVDLDGAPLEPVFKFDPLPDIVVETRPGRYHAYWLMAEPAQPDPIRFKTLQRALNKKFNADQSINDLPRVMRVPGFDNRKNEESFTITYTILTEDIKQKIMSGDLTVQDVIAIGSKDV